MKKILTILLGFTLFAVPSLFSRDKDGQGKMMMAADHFKKMDTDGDKKISKEEWQKYHDGFFQELDKDGDGSVSFDELKEKRMDQKEKMKEKAKDKKKQGNQKKQTKDSE
ncbi:hypothetical protein AB3N60_12575 [Leptospira sp. WS39.C2]